MCENCGDDRCSGRQQPHPQQQKIEDACEERGMRGFIELWRDYPEDESGWFFYDPEREETLDAMWDDMLKAIDNSSVMPGSHWVDTAKNMCSAAIEALKACAVLDRHKNDPRYQGAWTVHYDTVTRCLGCAVNGLQLARSDLSLAIQLQGVRRVN